MKQRDYVWMVVGVMWCGSFGYAQQQFSNQFIQFELPEDWSCHVVKTEWVCQNEQNPKARKEAIIVFAGKPSGPDDTLDKYDQYLNITRTIASFEGEPIAAKNILVRKRDIQGHNWVTAIKENSEIPGFLTHYAATTYQGIAILFTYSVLKSEAKKYDAVFARTIASLKPRREIPVAAGEKQPITSISVAELLAQEEKTAPKTEEELTPEVTITATDEPSAGSPSTWIVVVLVGAGVLAIVYIRRRRKKQLPPPPEEDNEDSDEEKNA